jgi:hypothetical protein
MQRRIMISLAVLAGALCMALPAKASAYMHADQCWQGLRNGVAGDRDRDDDVHRYGVYIGAAWAEGPLGAAHYDDTRVLVVVWFHFPNGSVLGVNGYCHGTDSSFNDNLPQVPSGW